MTPHGLDNDVYDMQGSLVKTYYIFIFAYENRYFDGKIWGYRA